MVYPIFLYVLQDDTYDSDGFWSVHSTGELAQAELDKIDGRNHGDFSIYKVPLDGNPYDWFLWEDGKVQFNGMGEWYAE